MNIPEKFDEFWWEDENGDKLEHDMKCAEVKKNARFYVVRRACEYVTQVDEYCYHPKNAFVKLLCGNKALRKIISRGKIKTFKPIFRGCTSYGSEFSGKCIVAMVNSGEYSLSDAIHVYNNACERCMNVLLFKYLDGKEGYPEYSEEWMKCGTVCDYCRGTDNNIL